MAKTQELYIEKLNIECLNIKDIDPLEIIKDNPVPSLDKEDINFLLDSSASYLNNHYNKSDDNKFEKIKSKLQNGRETNKEQPKCKNCGAIITQLEWCDECGYDQGNQVDDIVRTIW